ncbi:MAG: prepilin-type N-terminal cleavage/methylation domain-containing protein [Planctomycetes bacterium]|nr:prepilin-type N-terminal cleavage/methylation domain-containing protein [Planctomycetota bacterium]
MIRTRSPAQGFSLLEVIIATAILSASTVLLLSLFSAGDRHGRSAEDRVMAQMLCQSKVEELLAHPSGWEIATEEPFSDDSEWAFSVDWEPTDVDGLVRLRVSASKIETPSAAPAPRDADPREHAGPFAGRRVNERNRTLFEIVRWTRYASGTPTTSTRESSTRSDAASP